MPYNPSSAYPRHSTYTPPVYGREFPRAFNEVNYGAPFHARPTPQSANVGRAVQKALTPGTSSHIGLGLEAMGRRGIISMAQDALQQKTQEKQRQLKAAAAGPEAPSSDLGDRPQMTTAMQTRGGRRHVGNINERLGDIAQREESSTAMDSVIENVLTTKTAGRGKLPAWTTGFFRRTSPRGGA